MDDPGAAVTGALQDPARRRAPAAGAGGRPPANRRRWPPAAVLAAAVACAPAGAIPPGGPPALYVASAVDGTVAQFDAGTGRRLGPPLPAGAAPGQLARGPDGSLLVLSAARAAARPLTRIGPAGAGWAAHPVAWPGPTHEARLASDGGRYAVVVDRGPPTAAAAAPPWRLTLVDVPAGGVVAAAAVGGPHELVTGLALDDGPAGPVAYLALWRPWPAAPDDPSGAAGAAGGAGRVVAVDARTGATVAVLPLGGKPVPVALGPAPGRLGRRLYAVERLAGPEDEPPLPPRARLLGLHPTTLELESERPLDVLPARLAVAADGEVAYALHDHRLTRLGLAGGPDRRLALLPARGLALAVAGDRVYVSSAYSPEVWAFRHRDGRLVATLPVGAPATDLLLSPAE